MCVDNYLFNVGPRGCRGSYPSNVCNGGVTTATYPMLVLRGVTTATYTMLVLGGVGTATYQMLIPGV